VGAGMAFQALGAAIQGPSVNAYPMDMRTAALDAVFERAREALA